MPCLELIKPCACTESALEDFFSLVRGEKQEQGLEMVMAGLHAFVGDALPCFAKREDDADLSLHSLLSTLIQSDDAKHAHHQPPLGSEVAPTPGMSRPEPDSKRDKFLAQPLVHVLLGFF